MGCVAMERKEGDMLAGCRGKMYHHQTMRLSVVNAACTKSMSRGIQETDDWMLKWDGGGNSTLRIHDLAADTFLRAYTDHDHCNKNMRTDTLAPTGQHPEDAQDLLQGQGVQEAHPAQGHPVQGRQGATPPNSETDSPNLRD